MLKEKVVRVTETGAFWVKSWCNSFSEIAGRKEMIQLEEAPPEGPRHPGGRFRGCCLAIVEPDRAEEAAEYVRAEYEKAQPELVLRIPADRRVLVCESSDSVCAIL
jgi:galacturonokinase